MRVFRPLVPRLLLGALLSLPLGLGASVLSPAPALAADCPTPAIASSTKSARAVVTGEVLDSVRVDGEQGATFTHEVDVERIYKGPVTGSEVQVQTSGSSGPCALGRLELGETYLFFLQLDGDLWIATGSGGTQPATPAAVARVEDLLGSGDPAVPPEPTAAEFTRVPGADPVSISRAAAPGIALVLIGMLGLVVVGRLGRP